MPAIDTYSWSVSTQSGNRSDHFPAIEKKHGKPIAHWLEQLARLGNVKYEEQMAMLRDTHGFSRTHANAIVMQFRGSTTSKRFATVDDLLNSLEPTKATTVRNIFSTIQRKFPKLELVVAWNQPMLRIDGHYVIGVSASKNHLTINPFSTAALNANASKLHKYKVNKNTFVVPVDWKVDAALLHSLVSARLAER
jgi:uncharacterized protein